MTDNKQLTASEKVRLYLSAMEAGDYETSSALLAEDFVMTFPGNARFTKPEELTEWGSTRYRFVNKTYDNFDEITDGSNVIVYCFGTLGGEWLDGTPFSGIRFIDRFTIVDGKLTDQKVWNDFGQ